MLPVLPTHVPNQLRCREWLQREQHAARIFDLNGLLNCNGNQGLAVETNQGDVYICALVPKQEYDPGKPFSPKVFGSLLTNLNPVKELLVRASLRHRPIIKTFILSSTTDGIDENFSFAPKGKTLDWEDFFPGEDLPELDVVSKSAKLTKSGLFIQHTATGYGLSLEHHFTFALHSLSAKLASTMQSTATYPFNVPNAHSVFEGNSLLLQRTLEDWDAGEATREDPYLGQIQRLTCRQCSVGVFGYEGERLCVECGGGTTSVVGGAKRDLLKEGEALAVTPMTLINWRELDSRMNALVAAWRTAGNAGEVDDALWRQFQVARNRFYTAKDAFFAERRNGSESAAAERKTAIAERAETLASSTDWRGTSDIFSTLMTEWKEAGKIAKELDDRLWERFNGARQAFLTAKRASAELANETVRKRVAQKQALIATAAGISTLKDIGAGVAQMKDLMEEWKAVGSTGNAEGVLWDDFLAVRDAFFGAIRANQAINRDAKQALVAKSQQTANSSNWQEAAKEMRLLMERWRQLGSAGRADDDLLWTEFQAARMQFVTRQKAAFEELHNATNVAVSAG